MLIFVHSGRGEVSQWNACVPACVLLHQVREACQYSECGAVTLATFPEGAVCEGLPALLPSVPFGRPTDQEQDQEQEQCECATPP